MQDTYVTELMSTMVLVENGKMSVVPANLSGAPAKKFSELSADVQDQVIAAVSAYSIATAPDKAYAQNYWKNFRMARGERGPVRTHESKWYDPIVYKMRSLYFRYIAPRLKKA